MRRLTVAIATLTFVVSLGACNKDKPAAEPKAGAETPKPAETKPAAAAEKGDPKVLAAFKNVLDNCEVGSWGYVRRKTCKDPDAEKKLKKEEQVVGLKASLLTYCHKLVSENHLARALASYRISTMNYARKMAEAADPEVFACLLPQLAKVRERVHVRRLTKAVTYMGTALKKDADVIKAIEAQTLPIAKEAGYEALWANGRERVFPTLEKLIKDNKDAKLSVAAIKAFGYGERPNVAEMAKICGLLVPFMVNDNVDIASSAAYRVASVCTDKKDDVIKAAGAMIKTDKFNLTYVSALRTTAGWFREKASKKQAKEIIGVLKKVLKNAKVSDLTRSSALGAIHHVDANEGKKMAKKYKGDKATFVAKEAERILNKK